MGRNKDNHTTLRYSISAIIINGESFMENSGANIKQITSKSCDNSSHFFYARFTCNNAKQWLLSCFCKFPIRFSFAIRFDYSEFRDFHTVPVEQEKDYPLRNNNSRTEPTTTSPLIEITTTTNSHIKPMPPIVWVDHSRNQSLVMVRENPCI